MMRLTQIDPESWDLVEVVDALYAVAKGDYHAMAVLDLILFHDVWLTRDVFHDCIEVDTEDGNPLTAYIDWRRAAQITGPCSRSELAMLHIAASIVTRSAQVSIGDVVSGLDATNTRLVMNAVAHAAGHPYMAGGA